MPRLATLGAIGCCLLALGGCSNSSHTGTANKAGGRIKVPAATLMLANPDGDAQDLQEFVDAVKRISGGRMRIVIKHDVHYLELDRAAKLLSDLRSGAADIVKVDTRELDRTAVREFEPLSAPGLIDSLPLEKRVVTSPAAHKMLADVSAHGLAGIGLIPGELSKPIGITHALDFGDAFHRARLYATPSNVVSRTLEALGANPVPQLRYAIGRADGLERRIDAISPPPDATQQGPKLIMANVSLWPRTQAILMSSKRYAKLTPNQQRVLREAAVQAAPGAVARIQRATQESVAQLCAEGLGFMQDTPEQLAEVRSVFSQIRQSIARDPKMAAALASIEADKRKLAAPADAPECPPNPNDPSDPLSGKWSTVVTRDELPADAQGEYGLANWGHFTLVFYNGHFKWDGQDVPEKQPTLGTYAVKGNTLTLHPTYASFVAGRIWTLHWSRFHNQLTLTKAPAAPPLLVTHPWRRIGN